VNHTTLHRLERLPNGGLRFHASNKPWWLALNFAAALYLATVVVLRVAMDIRLPWVPGLVAFAMLSLQRRTVEVDVEAEELRVVSEYFALFPKPSGVQLPSYAWGWKWRPRDMWTVSFSELKGVYALVEGLQGPGPQPPAVYVVRVEDEVRPLAKVRRSFESRNLLEELRRLIFRGASRSNLRPFDSSELDAHTAGAR